jgi:hypothetical protein
MGKSRAPEVDEDGLYDYLSNSLDLKLVGLRNRFAEYEKLRQAEKLPVSFIAFDALASLLGAKIEGYSDADLRACWPETWGSGEVTVPATFLEALGNAWMQYKVADAGVTLGEVLGLEGGGQGRQRAITAQRKRDQHRLYGLQVALMYIGSSEGSTRPTLDQAIEAVAKEHCIGLETVKTAYEKFGRPLTEGARRRGILKGRKTS